MKDEHTVDWDDLDRRNYESRAFWYVHWRASARALFASAKELEPKVFDIWANYRAVSQDNTVPLKADYYHGPYFMLVAFAVENLFKAAIVARNSLTFRRSFSLTRRFPKELLGHNLVRLATKANFDYCDEEEDLLRRLTRHAIWAGRYPVPVDYKKSGVSENFGDGKKKHIAWFGAEDVERLNNLVVRIKKELGFDRG